MCAMSVITNSVIEGTCFLKYFDPESMDVLKWINSFEYLIDICQIPNERKAELLLNYLEPTALNNLRSKVSPVNLRNLSYDELISKLETCFSDCDGEWAGNYRFLHRDQFFGESVPHYVLALRKLSSKGNYIIRHPSNLMVRFINGLRDETIKFLLLHTENLTFARAVALAQQLELHAIANEIN